MTSVNGIVAPASISDRRVIGKGSHSGPEIP
jgi:hypothetical protein